MSQRLLEKYRIPYFSIDHLKMGLYRGDSSCGFTPLDSDEVIGEKLWPIIKGMIMTSIENNQNMIIEGCYILLGRTISQFIDEHDHFRRSCKEYDVPYFEIDQNYEEEIIKVYDFIEVQKQKIHSKLNAGEASSDIKIK